MIRMFFPYWEWEDYQNGMWDTPKNKKRDMDICLAFMDDTDLFGEFMLQVAKEWAKCSAQNLSDMSKNRVAWIGQAACCKGCGVSEDIVRACWYMLTPDKREAANKKALQAIDFWENNIYAYSLNKFNSIQVEFNFE